MGLFHNKKREEQKKLSNQVLLTVDATKSTTLTAYPDHLEIIRRGVKGARERHVYEYGNIIDITFQRPGDYNGYLKLSVPDDDDLVGKTYFYENFFKSKKKNEIAVTYLRMPETVQKMEQLYSILLDYTMAARRQARAQARQNGVQQDLFLLTEAEEQAAALRKFKELLDEGILTEEEFEQKKKEILSEKL